MNFMNITYPHATIVFHISVDDTDLYYYLKTYFGTAVSKADNRIKNNLEIYYMSIFYERNQMEIVYRNKFDKVYFNNSNLLHIVFMNIRDNLSFEDGWNAYHGTVVNLEGKNYLFMGESGAGKTTLVTYLLNACGAHIFTEDIVIINYFKNQVSPLIRPLYLRNAGYELLIKHHVKLEGKASPVSEYGIDRIRYIPNEAQAAKYSCSIDFCVILQIDRAAAKIYPHHDINHLVYNSYLHTSGVKNIKSSLRLSKIIPLYRMQYYGFSKVYEMLRSL